MKQIFFTLCLGINLFASAQTFDFGSPRGYLETDMSKITFHKMPAQNNAVLLANEMERRKNNLEKMSYFGTILLQNVSITNLGDVEVMSNGDRMTSYAISSPNAVSINLIFNDFFLSPGATVYVYNKEKTQFIGAHTSLNNNKSNVIGTDLLMSDNCIIELYEPKNEIGKSRLNLEKVIHGFQNIDELEKVLGSSGNCEIDVNCPIGAGWESQRNSAVMLVAGNGVCSAALINNVLNDFTPYILTANHCGFSATWVYRFRWESPVGQTVCGVAGNSGNGPEIYNINGGTLVSSSAPSDFLLTLMNSTPPPSWNIFYAGWSNSPIAATSGVGIHHPAGDIKKISFENEPLISTTFGGAGTDTHWGTTDWDNGVTEGGSSGSPLFDQNKRIIGQLHGGPSSCSPGATLQDQYGKVAVSWLGGGTPTSRLKDWLDPNNSNAVVLDGIDPLVGAPVLDGSVGSLSNATGTICSNSVTPTFTLYNPSTTPLTSAIITYGYDGSLSQTYNWTGNLAQFASATITLPSQTLTGGGHSVGLLLTQINGGADPIVVNNSINSSFTIIANARTFDLELKLDCYGSETTWKVFKNTTTIASGGPYTNDFTQQTVINESFCVSDTCFTFAIFDEEGDGIIALGSCPLTGQAKITNDLGVIVAQVLPSEASFPDNTIGDSIFKNSSCSTAGISDLLNNYSIKLYPNPASNNVFLNFGALEGNKEIQVLDASGKILGSFATKQNEIELQLASYAKGLYLINIITQEGQKVLRLTKE